MAKHAKQPDLVVVGGGPVGLAAALGSAADGHSVRLVTGRAVLRDDGRAAAILEDGLAWLDAIGAGTAIRQAGAPLAGIRIVDGSSRLFRAPTVLFKASEAGLDAFGASVETRRIVEILSALCAQSSLIERIEANVTVADAAETGVTLGLDDGRIITTAFCIAADGRRSLLREAAGIKARNWSYPQTALTFMVKHRQDHEDLSTEFHTEEGPMTYVPAGDRRSTVVWMMAPGRAERLIAGGPALIARESERLGLSILGRLEVISEVGAYPMSGLSVPAMSSGRIALVGETAHAFPPIGAQGLNLGLRDVSTLLAALPKGVPPSLWAGSPALAAWERARRRDAALTTTGVDALNRSLLSSLPPVAMARGAAMAALGAFAPLRRLAMTMGMGRRPALPGLSR
jgi:2-octaprenyl-6-methoxyphenol hydroxylase